MIEGAKQVMYPMLLEPSLHVKVWGGRKLETVLSKNLPTDEPYGEAWELHDTAVIGNGIHKGRTLGSLLQEYGAALIGPDNDPSEGFPLLAKFIDAADWLSVQVHPDDEQAHTLENQPRGKTEAWYILDADQDAQLVIGVETGTSRDDMAQAIHHNTLEKHLIYADVRPGDVLYIPAGTVHAVGPGILLYEIQQSSDTTYRLYDWGRMDLTGQPRTLHIDKGVQVSNVETLPQITHVEENGAAIVQGDYFVTYLHILEDNSLVLNTGGRRFHTLTCIDGLMTVRGGEQAVTIHQGQTVLIPADLVTYTISGIGRLLRSLQSG
jgi:mannose-6-phosphate isomerase